MTNKITQIFIERILKDWPEDETKHQVKSQLETEGMNVKESIEYLMWTCPALINPKTLN